MRARRGRRRGRGRAPKREWMEQSLAISRRQDLPVLPRESHFLVPAWSPLTLVTSLPLPRVVDLHRLRFLAATIFVPLEDVMVFIDDLDHFADFLLHAGNPFVFACIGKRFGRGIVVAFGHHDAGAHVVYPAADEFLFHVVVAVNAHAFESHLLLLAVRLRHLHFSSHIHDKVASVHHRFSYRRAFIFFRLRVWVRVHPHFDVVCPRAGQIRQQLVILAGFGQLHHLSHHFLHVLC